MADDKVIRFKLSSPEITIREGEIPSLPPGPGLGYLISLIEEIRNKLDLVYEDYEDYLYVEDTVDNLSTKDIDVETALDRISKSGWIVNDSSGTIYVKINNGDRFPLNAGEKFEWGLKAVRLVVRRIVISTDSSSPLAFRLFCV